MNRYLSMIVVVACAVVATKLTAAEPESIPRSAIKALVDRIDEINKDEGTTSVQKVANREEALNQFCTKYDGSTFSIRYKIEDIKRVNASSLEGSLVINPSDGDGTHKYVVEVKSPAVRGVKSVKLIARGLNLPEKDILSIDKTKDRLMVTATVTGKSSSKPTGHSRTKVVDESKNGRATLLLGEIRGGAISTGTRSSATVVLHLTDATVKVLPRGDAASKPESEAAKAKDSGIAQPAAGKPVSGSRWINTSYNNTLSNIQGNQWVETDNTTNKVSWHFTEVERNGQFVELKRKETTNELLEYRVYADHMNVKNHGKWEWISNGHWSGYIPKATPLANGTSAETAKTSSPEVPAPALDCDTFKEKVLKKRGRLISKDDFYKEFGKPASVRDVPKQFTQFGTTTNPGASVQQAISESQSSPSAILTYNLSDGVVEVSIKDNNRGKAAFRDSWRVLDVRQVQ